MQTVPENETLTAQHTCTGSAVPKQPLETKGKCVLSSSGIIKKSRKTNKEQLRKIHQL